MSCIVLDIELTEKNANKELRLFIDGFVQGFSFHGIGWSSGKMDYEKLFAVFCDKQVMNAEVFVKGLEKCRLLTNLLGQIVENLDDYGCPKIQDLVKTDSLWICSSYPFRHKTRLHCAERKAKLYGEWANQNL